MKRKDLSALTTSGGRAYSKEMEARQTSVILSPSKGPRDRLMKRAITQFVRDLPSIDAKRKAGREHSPHASNTSKTRSLCRHQMGNASAWFPMSKLNPSSSILCLA